MIKCGILFSSLSRRFSSEVRSNFPQISCFSRDVEGSRGSRNLRSQGLIPGILYGPDDKGDKERVLVSFKAKDLNNVMRRYGNSLENTIFTLVLDESKEYKVTPRDLQLDPVTDEPYGVNFLRFRRGRKVSIPITYLNRESSPGLKRGGYINYIKRELDCICEFDQIPSSFDIDLTGKHVGDKIAVSDIQFPEGIIPCPENHLLVSTIGGKRGLRLAVNKEEREETIV